MKGSGASRRHVGAARERPVRAVSGGGSESCSPTAPISGPA